MPGLVDASLRTASHLWPASRLPPTMGPVFAAVALTGQPLGIAPEAMFQFIAPLLTVIALGLVHAYSGSGGAERHQWRHRGLSIAGGISVTYVFLELLPGLVEQQDVVTGYGFLPSVQRHVYVCALIGLIVAYAVEVATRRSKRSNAQDGVPGATSVGTYRLSIWSFAVYNAAIGYVVADPGDLTVQPYWLFVIAMGLHFAVNDHVLAAHHGARYEKGRWLLIGGLAVGWAVGAIPSLEIPPPALALILAYIAGGTVMNILRHELPDTERDGDVGAFVLASIVYGAFTILLEPASL